MIFQYQKERRRELPAENVICFLWDLIRKKPVSSKLLLSTQVTYRTKASVEGIMARAVVNFKLKVK